jgi:hydrogenase-4 component B
MMTAEQSVFIAIALAIGGAVVSLLVSRNKAVAGWVTFVVSSVSAITIFSAARASLAGQSEATVEVFRAGPAVFRFHVDGLAAVFLCLAAFMAALAALYSIAYMRNYEDYGVARYYPNFLLFVAGMYGVLATTDMMWIFCGFWQLMTLSSYGLIRFEYKKKENVHAANRYLGMMEIACALVMLGARVLAHPAARGWQKYDFDAVSANLPSLLAARPGTVTLAFALFLIGFGIKAGMWPFGQMWLPDAHPAAPSPVSALLSGVMIKTGVYGLMRCFLWLVPVSSAFPLAEWGLMVSGLGTVTLFTGTMQALKQEQSKRLLAFHSIGQIGYILLGTGACVALLPGKSAAAGLAGIALIGALFHVLNHGLFKGLLFLNAGSMLEATGTQDLNQMGGLMKYMPTTAVTALIASLSISGVPLFNGFASKWTIYVAVIQGRAFARYLPACAVIAILTSALTLASFIKFFGVSFLSRTSSLVRQRASVSAKLEVPWPMQVPQVLLGLLCVAIGIVPAMAVRFLGQALSVSPGSPLPSGTFLSNEALQGLKAGSSGGLFVPLALLTILAVLFAIAYRISRVGQSARRASDPWLCGYMREAESNRYIAHNFYGEIKRYFGWVGGTPRRAGKAPIAKGLS